MRGHADVPLVARAPRDLPSCGRIERGPCGHAQSERGANEAHPPMGGAQNVRVRSICGKEKSAIGARRDSRRPRGWRGGGTKRAAVPELRRGQALARRVHSCGLRGAPGHRGQEGGEGETSSPSHAPHAFDARGGDSAPETTRRGRGLSSRAEDSASSSWATRRAQRGLSRRGASVAPRCSCSCLRVLGMETLPPPRSRPDIRHMASVTGEVGEAQGWGVGNSGRCSLRGWWRRSRRAAAGIATTFRPSKAMRPLRHGANGSGGGDAGASSESSRGLRPGDASQARPRVGSLANAEEESRGTTHPRGASDLRELSIGAAFEYVDPWRARHLHRSRRHRHAVSRQHRAQTPRGRRSAGEIEAGVRIGAECQVATSGTAGLRAFKRHRL